MSERASAREGGQEGGRDGGESMLSVERARSRAREKVPAYQRLTAVSPMRSGISCSSSNHPIVSCVSAPSLPIPPGRALDIFARATGHHHHNFVEGHRSKKVD